jgi:hypothetical protein
MPGAPQDFGKSRLLPKAYPVVAIIVLAGLSIGFAFGARWVAAQFGWTDYTSLALESLLAFMVVELGYLLKQTYSLEDQATEAGSKEGERFQQVENLVEDKARLIGAMALRNHEQHDAANNLLKIFQYHDKPAHTAVRKALVTFARGFVVEDDYISFDGEFLSREMYQNFWQALIDEQKRRKDSGLPSLAVGITHSASVRLWNSVQFRALLRAQRKFVGGGGKIFRVLLKSEDGPDKDDVYEKAMKKMDARGIRVFFLRVEAIAGELMHDYILASINQENYAVVWKSDIDVHKHYGNIYGSKIEIGEARCADYRERWSDVIEMLEEKKDELGPLERDPNAPLTWVPEDKEFDEMRALF